MRILLSDYHVGTQLWQAEMLRAVGHTPHVQSLSGHARFIGSPKIHPVIEAIGELYGGVTGAWSTEKTDIVRRRFGAADVDRALSDDACLASFPPGLYRPFAELTNMRLLVNAGHRFNLGCRTPSDHAAAIASLQALAADGRHMAAAMSRYDCEYIQHYTGLDVRPLHVACRHLGEPTDAEPTSNVILVGPAHVQRISPFTSVADLNRLARRRRRWWQPRRRFELLRTRYPRYTHKDLRSLLGRHRAAVLFPYSAFSISGCEIYESSIPCFVPSIELLVEQNLMHDRVLWPTYCTEMESRAIDAPHSASRHAHSPNSYDNAAQRYWLQFAYFYQRKHAIVWSSPDDLMEKLETVDLMAVRRAMAEENAEHWDAQLAAWREALS